LLAANPDKEAKMVEEIDAFGRDATPGYDDLVKVSDRCSSCLGRSWLGLTSSLALPRLQMLLCTSIPTLALI
jgi:hypothetical protein